ncbi:hypothetical protein HPP92_011470 [Vanilla planifolia]|uniref:CFA20 domain-containing protein n=1 Tax=Vanilla planifolia TaxID=51239 RepID=A0A835QZP1_VANPL|nr:hypothetical protein HPP92_011756 [Vanilla planifolia]KAG0483386.1 hypothetical protein HPP92_011470 [Vanilla planifolia]
MVVDHPYSWKSTESYWILTLSTYEALFVSPPNRRSNIRGISWGIMFKNTFQSGFLSILYSLGSKPLQIWDKEALNGQIKRPHDEDIQSSVLEIVGSNVQSTYITCPADPAATLGIKLPFLVMIVKNLKKYFTFEIQVLDDKNVRRRFRASNYQVCCDTCEAFHLHYAS